jgi:hypothetical protein
LRLALLLEDHPIPIPFIVECLVIAGLSADERKEDLFTIFLNEPEEIPMSQEAAQAYVLQGAEQIAALGLGQLSENFVMLPSLTIRAFSRASSTSPRQGLLGEAALQVLYIIAEASHASQNFDRLSAVAPHARKLVGDLRERMISQEDNAGEITGRIRLALHLADLDLLHGAKARATAIYRATSAYLVRAMAADPHNSTRQKDFARAQEQLGDLMVETTQPQGALDHRALVLDQGVEQLFLALEVGVERALRPAQAGGDHRHGRGVEAFFEEDFPRGLQNPLPALVAN